MPDETAARTAAKAGTIDTHAHPAERVPTASEAVRVEALRRLTPRGQSALEIGARHGFFTLVLREFFAHVTALDIEKLPWDIDGVDFVQGDVRDLTFSDGSFDCVICTEVLEHIDGLESAVRELERVSRRHLVISVPYRQDLRLGRTYCAACHRVNPAYGHIHSFDEARLAQLFPRYVVEELEFVGKTQEATTVVSAALMTWAKHPWGTYEQAEPCIYCARQLKRPPAPPVLARLAAKIALHIDRVAAKLARPRPMWMYARLRKS